MTTRNAGAGIRRPTFAPISPPTAEPTAISAAIRQSTLPLKAKTDAETRLAIPARTTLALLALLGIAWSADLHRANGAKVVLAGMANLVSASVFAFSGKVDW